MSAPSPSASQDNRSNDVLGAHGERLDADRDRFNAIQRRDAWRFGVWTALAAVVVFCSGVWGFEHATRYRTAHTLQRTLATVPAGAMIVVINPR